MPILAYSLKKHYDNRYNNKVRSPATAALGDVSGY